MENAAAKSGALASLGSVPEPEDLVLRIRVAVSRERARRNKSSSGLSLAWRNTVGPFLLQAAQGLPALCSFSAPSLCWWGCLPSPKARRPPRMFLWERDCTSIALAGRFRQRGRDRRNRWSSGGRGLYQRSRKVYDYRIVSGSDDAATRAQVENMLLLSRFEPARFFGQPVRGLAVLSFSGVSVRG